MSAPAAFSRVARRLEALELQTLRALCERQHEEIALLRAQLAAADQAAESWRDDALDLQIQLCELTHARPGITKEGRLVVSA